MSKEGWMLRLYDKEVMGCTSCGELTGGDTTRIVYVWVVLKQTPEVGRKDEMDVWCEKCWEKEEE